MSTNTNNYKLIKPAQEDFYNVDDFNNNADIIDSQLKAVSDKATSALPSSSYTAADILNKLKTVDGANSGLDADLFKGQSIIPIANGGTGANEGKKSQITFVREGMNVVNCKDNYLYNYVASYNNQEEFDWLPPVLGGWKQVMNFFSSSFLTQLCMMIPGNDESPNADRDIDLYVRNRYQYSGLWSNWVKLITEKNIATMMNTAFQSGDVSVVKSVQRGVINIATGMLANTATINAVNTNKAIVIYGGIGYSGNVSNSGTIDSTYLTLTNSTTVTATRQGSSSNISTTVPYQLIEFY